MFVRVVEPENTSINPSETSPTISLQAWITNDVLHIKGLTIGQPYYLYNISGTLVYQGIATMDIEMWQVASLPQGTYILHSGNRSVKIVK